MMLRVLVILATAQIAFGLLNLTDPYSETDAKRFVHYSFSSYCPQSNILSWNCYFCSDATSGFKATAYSYDSPTDTAAFIGVHEARAEIVISFRGTDPLSLKNWIDDLNFFKTDTPVEGVPNAYVHRGFYNAWMAHKDQVVSEVQRLRTAYPTFQVWVTGHSLGGAQATLCALDLVHNYGIPVKSYNFGTPRVGNDVFASAVAQAVPDYYRVVHLWDIVPHLPPAAFGFHHSATEIWYPLLGGYKVCDNSGEDKSCSDSAIDLSIPDHLDYVGVVYLACLN